MLKKLSTTAAILVILSAPQAFAQVNSGPDVYGELGFVGATITDSGYGFGTAGVGVARLGVNLHKNFSAEVMAGAGMSSPSFYYGSALITTHVNSMFGVYGKLRGQVADNFEVFARLGLTQISGTVTASGPWYRASSTAYGHSPSYGVGAQFDFSKTVYGQIDYMSYFNYNSIIVRGPSASIGFKF